MKTLPGIFKRSGVYLPAPTQETTIIKAPSGQVVTLTFTSEQSKLTVRDFASGSVITEVNWPVTKTGGGTAIVSDGVLYVFASAPFITPAGNSIVRAQFDSNWVMSTPVTVYTATAPDNLCNLGICASPCGFVMSCETQQPAHQVFFLKSTDLTNWSAVGTAIASGAYIGSPKIHYSQRRNLFFLTLLRQVNGNLYYTAVAKLPPSLSSYEIASNALVYPDGAGETLNASDLTMVEANGKTCMVYLDGDQTAYGNYRAALYDGTMEQLWEQFFPLSGISPPPGTTNQIPAMTGPNTSGVTMSASDSFQYASFLPWMAADRDGSTFWHCNTSVAYPHWLQVMFSTAKTINSYSIKPRSGFVNQSPKTFTLQGLNGSWVTLDAQSNQSYTDGVAKIFTLASAATYTSFRWVMDSNVEGSTNLSIGEVELLG